MKVNYIYCYYLFYVIFKWFFFNLLGLRMFLVIQILFNKFIVLLLFNLIDSYEFLNISKYCRGVNDEGMVFDF